VWAAVAAVAIEPVPFRLRGYSLRFLFSPSFLPMKFSPASLRRLHWLNLPGTLLIALLQRTPAVRVVATAADTVLASPATSVLKAAVSTLGAFGAMHSMAGATALSPSQPSPASVTAGVPTTLVFTVTGSPAAPQSFTFAGSVPPGMTFRALGSSGAGTVSGPINTSTVQLSGTPTTAGTYVISIIGWRGANGSSDQHRASYTVTVTGSTNAAPTITTQPTSRTVAAGSPASFTTVVTGSPTPTLQWFKNSVAVPGATTELLTFASAALADAGSYTLVATNSQGSVTSNVATLTVTGGVARPEVVAHPTSVARPLGAGAALAIVATGSPTYQWRKNGVAVAGATAATLSFASLAAADTASYDVVLTNAAGSIISDSATVVVAAPLTAVLRNLSVRTTLAADQILIVGVDMSGAGKEVLVRAVGPSLGVFGVPGTMADPRLAVFTAATPPVQIAQNDNWGGNAAVAAANLRLGAFALTPNTSLDAALVTTIAGGRTVQVSGPTAGTVIVEAYDAGAGNAARFTSIAARNLVGTGGDVLIAGFTVDGTGSKNLLIRAAGPSLGALGVPGTLVDPKLEVFTAAEVPQKVAENDNFAGAVDTLARTLGGFEFVSGAKDAALLLSLPAGGYTVQVSGINNGTGEAIIEVYEVP
jgi:Immunoglobulin I-set domain